MLEALVLVVVGLVAGVVNTLAGGGSFLTLAALLWLGLPPQVANATNRVGVVGQSLTSTTTFYRQGLLAPALALGLEVLTAVLGALAGAGLAAVLPADAFEGVLIVAMVVVVVASLARPQAWSTPGDPSPWRYPALFAAGAYGGFLQAGVGVLMLPALVMLGGKDAVRATAHKVAIIAVLTAVSLVVFAVAGQISWLPGLWLALGGLFGGAIGARLSVAGGARWIRRAVALVVVITVVRLLWP